MVIRLNYSIANHIKIEHSNKGVTGSFSGGYLRQRMYRSTKHFLFAAWATDGKLELVISVYVDFVVIFVIGRCECCGIRYYNCLTM